MNKEDIIISASLILAIIFFLVSIYFIFLKIFGNSPTDLQVILTIATLLVSLLIFTIGSLYKLNREVGEFKINTKNSFDRFKEDVTIIKETTEKIKKKLRIK